MTTATHVYLEDVPLSEILKEENAGIKFKHKDCSLYYEYNNGVIYLHDIDNAEYDPLCSGTLLVSGPKIIEAYYLDGGKLFTETFGEARPTFSDHSDCQDYTVEEVLEQ